MEIRDLQVFLTVSRHLNFTRAGEELHLSQPSVSVRISSLQRELGAKLFEQIGKRIVLTETGRVLVPYATKVIAALDDAYHAIGELQGLQRGLLTIGASTTPGMYVLPKVIAEFKRLHPRIEVRLRIRDTHQIENAVAANEFDFGFVGGHLAANDVEVLPWRTDTIILIVPPKHPLTRRKSVKPKDLEKESFVLRETGSATQATIASHLEKKGIQLNSIGELENPESVKRAVESGLGIAFISGLAVETELKNRSLIAVRVSDLNIKRELKIVHRREKHLSKSAQEFIRLARGRSA
jgi:LysR family transcriptional regulator, low CO2-responsive transcriptional regulator